MKKILLSLVAIATILSSCSIEKRLHTDGYHIEWYSSINKSKVQHPAQETNTENIASAVTQENLNECETISADKEVIKSIPALIQLDSPQTEEIAAEKNRINRKEMRQAVKELRKDLKQQKQSSSPMQLFSGNTNVTHAELIKANEPDVVLLVVLAFFIPPLAVYLYEGSWTKRCTTNLILTLLCGLPGLIHALVVILE
jgi:uncharacterized membrane protein YqaE (UPF0057 family)